MEQITDSTTIEELADVCPPMSLTLCAVVVPLHGREEFVHSGRPESASRKVRVGGRRGKKIEIAESRSFLVDIHLLKR